MLFKKSKEGVSNSFPINKSKWVLWLLVGIILISIAGYSFLSVKSFVDKITKNWDVIQFSMTKPEAVRNLKDDYASKSAELEKSLGKNLPTPQDQLIEEVLKQLKTSK